MIKVAVCGANGKMGQEVCNAVEADNSMKLAAKNRSIIIIIYIRVKTISIMSIKKVCYSLLKK